MVVPLHHFVRSVDAVDGQAATELMAFGYLQTSQIQRTTVGSLHMFEGCVGSVDCEAAARELIPCGHLQMRAPLDLNP
jgi:hypothetical protein